MVGAQVFGHCVWAGGEINHTPPKLIESRPHSLYNTAFEARPKHWADPTAPHRKVTLLSCLLSASSETLGHSILHSREQNRGTDEP